MTYSFRSVLCAVALALIASCATTEKVSKRFSGAFVSYTVDATKPEINSLSMASSSKPFIRLLKTAIRSLMCN